MIANVRFIVLIWLRLDVIIVRIVVIVVKFFIYLGLTLNLFDEDIDFWFCHKEKCECGSDPRSPH